MRSTYTQLQLEIWAVWVLQAQCGPASPSCPARLGTGPCLFFLGSGNPHDCVDPGTKSLKSISLEIRSSSGDLVDFQGGRYIAVFVVGTKP